MTKTTNSVPRPEEPRHSQQQLYKLYDLVRGGNSIIVAEQDPWMMDLALQLVTETVQAERSASKPKHYTIAIILAIGVSKVSKILNQLTTQHGIKARSACSTCKTDTFERQTWHNIFEDYEAIVMTPQICLTMLRLRFLKLENVSLMVFDDCHQAQRSYHPYKLIMNEIYHPMAPTRRPQVLGLTSLPPHNAEVASSLASTFDARFLVPDTPNLFAAKVEDTIATYSVRPDKFQQAALGMVQAVKDDMRFVPHLRAFKNALTQFGSWGAFHLWLHVLSLQLQKEAAVKAKQGDEEMENEGQVSLNALLDKVIDHRQSFADIEADLSNVSNKIKKLCGVIQDARSQNLPQDSFRAIIFVQRRLDAFVLHSFLRLATHMTELGLEGLLVGMLVGKDSDNIGNLGITLDEQQLMLDSFASGKYNILVATAALDETLDFPPCELVIRFDPPPNLESYLLSQRLARDGNSKHIIMQSSDRRDIAKRLQDEAARIREWCLRQALQTPRLHTARSEDDMDTTSTTGSIDETSTPVEFVISTTGAKITMDSAVSVLNLYGRLLPKEASHSPTIPTYTSLSSPNAHTVTVTLPAEFSLRSSYSNPVPMAKKRDARKAAAFEACKDLYHNGFLDGDLLPTLKSRGITIELQEAPALVKNRPKGEQPSVEGDLPAFWKEHPIIIGSGRPHLMHMTTFTLREASGARRRYRTLAILTPLPLGRLLPIDVYFDGMLEMIDVAHIKSPLFVEESELQDIHDFHSRMTNHAYRKPVDIGCLNGAWYVFAPLVKDIQPLSPFAHGHEVREWIDWAQVKEVASATFDVPLDSIPYETLETNADDMVVFERSMRTRLFYTKSIHRDKEEYAVLRKQLEAELQELNKSANVVLEAIKEHSHLAIFPVDRVPRLENNLQTDAKLKRRHRTTRTKVLSDQCCVLPVSATISRMYHLVPTILNRLDSLVMTEAYRHSFDIPQIMRDRFEQDLLLESLTASVTGMSVSYERLEMLGDTFVKFLTTTDLFVRCPMSDEGKLTLMRRDAISNQALFDLANARSLYKYLTTFPLPTWHHEQSHYRPVPADYAKPIMATNAPTITVPAPAVKFHSRPPSAASIGAAGATPSSKSTDQPADASTHRDVVMSEAKAKIDPTGNGTDSSSSSTPALTDATLSPTNTARSADAVPSPKDVEPWLTDTVTLSEDATQSLANATTPGTSTKSPAVSATQIPRKPSPTSKVQPQTPKGQPPTPKIKSKKLQLSRKMMADIIESTLGAAYIAGGRDMGLTLAKQYGHPTAKDLQSWNDFGVMWEARLEVIRKDLASPNKQIKKLYPLSLAVIMKPDDEAFKVALEKINYKRIERIVGYQFRDKRILIEALAHPTVTKGYTYQRLEFLGDAVVDMITVDYWFRRQPRGDQGLLTMMKVESVNQQILGCLTLLLGLHRELRHESPLLARDWFSCMIQIADALELKELDEVDLAEYEELPPLYERMDNFFFEDYLPYLRRRARAEREHDWPNFWTSLPIPKTSGDIFEAIMGALYQDSGFTLAAAERFFAKTLRVLLELFLSPVARKEHPVKLFLEGLQKKGCTKGTIHTVPVPNMLSKKSLAAMADSHGSLLHSEPGIEYPVFEYLIPPENSDKGGVTAATAATAAGVFPPSPVVGTKRSRSDDDEETLEEGEIVETINQTNSNSGGDGKSERKKKKKKKKHNNLMVNVASGDADPSALSTPPASSKGGSWADAEQSPAAADNKNNSSSSNHRPKDLRQAELFLHGHLMIRATHVDIPEARKSVARRGIELFLEPPADHQASKEEGNGGGGGKGIVADPILDLPLLDRFCDCLPRQKLKFKASKGKMKREAVVQQGAAKQRTQVQAQAKGA